MPDIASVHTSSAASATRSLDLRPLVWSGLLVWFATAFSLASRGAFVSAPGDPPLALLLAVAAPPLLFLLLVANWPALRRFALQADLRILVGMQAWRVGGLGFITLTTYGLLPAYFAWPAALGDAAVAVTAPWVVLALVRDSRFISSRAFLSWNIFGLFDFAVLAVGSGAAFPLLFPQIAQSMQTPQMVALNPIQHLPLVLVPTFLVPMFTIFHLIALLQARSARREAASH